MDDGTLGVYVHVPFCERICPYCDFAVIRARTLDPAREGEYVAALCDELSRAAPAWGDRRLVTLYLGGGTPSLLRPDSVGRIVEAVRGSFPPGPLEEVTLEVNPSTVERGRLPAFRGAGVDRLSIGIQSFDDRVLQRLGRAHRAEEGLRTLAAARAAGFGNLSADLIFGVPGQRVASFAGDVDRLISEGVPHVSVYALTVEEGTPYARAVERRILRLPEENETVEMFALAGQRLEEAGRRRYELSSFARAGAESRHNRRYWERRPVLGLGVGAWSVWPPSAESPFGARSANVRALGTYLERVAEGFSPAEGEPERLDARTARGEAVFLALRTREGLAARAFEREFGASPRAFYADAIDTLGAQGLLEEETDGSLRLTSRGILLSDSVFVHFV